MYSRSRFPFTTTYLLDVPKKVKDVITEKLLDKRASVHINHKIELLSLNALNGSINLSIICFFLRRTTVTRIGLGTAVRT